MLPELSSEDNSGCREAYRPSEAQPCSSRLPFPSSTGYDLASASMRVVYLDMTSGLSRK